MNTSNRINNTIPKKLTIPGQGMGITTMEQLHHYNGQLIRRKGESTALAVGSNTINVRMPGTAKKLIGINLWDNTGDSTNTCSLVVNNDTLIDNVQTAEISRNFPDVVLTQFARYNDEFFYVGGMLSGNDLIQLDINANTGGADLFVTLYYI